MSFIWKVEHYLKSSEEKNIISWDQKRQIIKLIEQESWSLWFFKILSIIGAICVGTWVILIIAGNWWFFPKIIQLLLAFALPIIPLLVWYYFSYVQKDLKVVWQVFIYLSGILIWASIALVWQIYNTDGTVWSLFLLWLLLVLPLTYIFRFKVLAVLATFLFYGVCYYYTFEVFFTSWKDEEYIIATFTVISGLMAAWSYTLNSMTQFRNNYLLLPVSVISLKILFLFLFLATIDYWFMFLGDGILWILIHNILFLWAIFWCMWWAHQNHEIILRHSTFLWIGAWITVKYFELAWWYLGTWVFFLFSGFFLIGLVYSYIKINKYLQKT